MSTQVPPILLVGGGKMGEALAKAWQHISALTIVEPDGARADFLRHHFTADVQSHAPARLGAGDWIVILAVKPNMMKSVLASYRHLAQSGHCLFVSVAAGYPFSSLKAGLGEQARILRVMPNTPVAVGRGMSVGYAGPHVQASDCSWIETLFGTVGELTWVQNEDELHTITALSGSGPAYLFLLVEILTKIGVGLGIGAVLAEKLARATLIGAGELLHCRQESAKMLRCDVTSPGGVTQAALEHLMADDRLAALFTQAVGAAAQHSRNMEKNLSEE